MHILPFALERYFARYEFKVEHLLSASDCESLTQAELLALADDESRRLWDELRLGYTESAGHPLLRAAAAEGYDAVDADGIVVAAPEEAIFVAMQVLLAPGDHVVAVAPAYQSLHEVARGIGCAVTAWPAERVGNGWRFDVERLAHLVTPQTRLIVVNFPHNPTGHLLTHEELWGVVDLAERRSVWLFSDEMYRGLEYDPIDRLPAACDLSAQAISLAGLSKSHALPGLRIGWLATQDAGLVERFLVFKDYTTICSSAPSEILGLIGLRAGRAIVARNVAIVRDNLGRAERFCAAWPQLFEWLPPHAGSVAFPRWCGPGSVEAFCQGALDRCGVMVVPDGLFGMDGGYFRVGLGRRSFPRALAQLESHLAAFAQGEHLM